MPIHFSLKYHKSYILFYTLLLTNFSIISNSKIKSKLDLDKLKQDYSNLKLSLEDVSQKYKISISTIYLYVNKCKWLKRSSIKKNLKFKNMNNNSANSLATIKNFSIKNNPYKPIINSLHIAIKAQIKDFEMSNNTKTKKITKTKNKAKAISASIYNNKTPTSSTNLIDKDRSARTLSSLVRSLEKLIDLENKSTNHHKKSHTASSLDNGNPNSQDKRKAAIIRQQITQKLKLLNKK